MIKIKDLSLKLNNKEVLNKINIHIEKNKITAILGKNASSKTSLIKCINGTYRYSGTILLEERNILDISLKDLSKKISYLPQILKYPHILVLDILKMGRNPYLGINNKLTETDLKIINQTIDQFNLNALLDKYLDELSGGQRQLVYLAMQIIQDAKVMIFDEPSSFMDVNYEASFLKMIKELNQQKNKTIVVVMHNINQIIKYADNVIVLDEGKVVFNGTTNKCIDQQVIEKVFNLRKYQIADMIIYEN